MPLGNRSAKASLWSRSPACSPMTAPPSGQSEPTRETCGGPPSLGMRPGYGPKSVTAHHLGEVGGRETAFVERSDAGRVCSTEPAGKGRPPAMAMLRRSMRVRPELNPDFRAEALSRSSSVRDSQHATVRRHTRLRLGRLAQILVPLDILRRTADLDDVRAPVSIDVGDRATGGGHSHRVEILMQPFRPAVIL